MEVQEARKKFILSWGSLGSKWGINRTMAQIHALLLLAPDPLSTGDVMQELKISRGNANMNIRELIHWELVRKELLPGERKEFFVAEKDMWKVFRNILRERKKRELDPMLHLLETLADVKGDKKDPKFKCFQSVLHDLSGITGPGNRMLERALASDRTWFLKTLSKLL